MRKCNKCGIDKPISEMTKGKRGNVAPFCKLCKAANKKDIKRRKSLGIFVNLSNVNARANNFLIKAVEVHGTTYRYDRMNYIDAHTDIEIFCTKHQGYFWQTPTSHTSGNGCFDCGIKQTASKRKYTKEEYIALAKEVWGDEFDYTDMEYLDCFTPIKIKCKVHGVVEVVPTQHLSGRGCKKCAKNGYSVDKPGHLYVLTMGNLTKVGITNMTPGERAKILSRGHDSNFEVVESLYWEDGNIANEVETQILRELRQGYANPEDNFHGWTETFIDVNTTELIEQIKGIVQHVN